MILGIGNETNGDDAAGSCAARALAERLAEIAHVRVIDAGIAPENQTGPVRRFAPDLVVMIDAAQMNETPGAIRWLDWAETDGLSASTHTLPPYVLAKYLVAETGCAVGVIGIQPAQTGFGIPLSDVMAAAVADVVEGVAGEVLALG